MCDQIKKKLRLSSLKWITLPNYSTCIFEKKKCSKLPPPPPQKQDTQLMEKTK